MDMDNVWVALISALAVNIIWGVAYVWKLAPESFSRGVQTGWGVALRSVRISTNGLISQEAQTIVNVVIDQLGKHTIGRVRR